jgi:putative tricarboxylic transport membrane protein
VAPATGAVRLVLRTVIMDNNVSSHGEAVHGKEYTVSNRVMELVVAAMFMAVGAVVMIDNWETGIGWGAEGPKAGVFPFIMGLLMFLSAGAVFVTNLTTKHPDLTTFVERSQLKSVMQVLIPSIVLVIAIVMFGLYVPSAIFIAFFMMYLGKYPLWKAVPIAVGVPLVLFVMFEIWFLVPLPKGPVEAFLGY